MTTGAIDGQTGGTVTPVSGTASRPVVGRHDSSRCVDDNAGLGTNGAKI